MYRNRRLLNEKDGIAVTWSHRHIVWSRRYIGVDGHVYWDTCVRTLLFVLAILHQDSLLSVMGRRMKYSAFSLVLHVRFATALDNIQTRAPLSSPAELVSPLMRCEPCEMSSTRIMEERFVMPLKEPTAFYMPPGRQSILHWVTGPEQLVWHLRRRPASFVFEFLCPVSCRNSDATCRLISALSSRSHLGHIKFIRCMSLLVLTSSAGLP